MKNVIFAGPIGKTELFLGNNTLQKRPKPDFQFSNDSGFNLENYDTIKTRNTFEGFLIT